MYCELNMLPHAIFSWSDAYETLEVFAKEGRIGEIEIIGNTGHGFVRVHEFHFYAHDEGTVYPFLGRDTAGLADNGAQVALGEAETVGIVANLMLLGTVLID